MESDKLKQALGEVTLKLMQVENVLKMAAGEQQQLQQEAARIANQIAALENKPPGDKDADNS